jgi:putative flippase GtrA
MSLTHFAEDGINRAQGLLAPFRKIITEFSKFGAVGLIALVVDIGLFNLLLYASPGEVFADKPITAKAASVIVATTVSYFLNRVWTFSSRARTGVAREYSLFIVLNGVAMLITLGTLWFSHYALGLTSPLADNVSANIVGLAMGTAFRFWSYRKWVFPESDGIDSLDPVDPIHTAATPNPRTGLDYSDRTTIVDTRTAVDLPER